MWSFCVLSLDQKSYMPYAFIQVWSNARRLPRDFRRAYSIYPNGMYIRTYICIYILMYRCVGCPLRAPDLSWFVLAWRRPRLKFWLEARQASSWQQSASPKHEAPRLLLRGPKWMPCSHPRFVDLPPATLHLTV